MSRAEGEMLSDARGRERAAGQEEEEEEEEEGSKKKGSRNAVMSEYATTTGMAVAVERRKN